MEAFASGIGNDYSSALKRIRLVKASEKILFQGIRLIDGTGRSPRDGVSLLVEDGKIGWIGPQETAPEQALGAETIAAEGKTLMPGLMDCHVHFSGEATAGAYQRYLDPPLQVRLLRAATDAFDALASGFTTVRDAGTASGVPIALRRAISDNVIMGPRIYAAGDALSQSNGHGDWHVFPYSWMKDLQPRAWLVDGVEECRKAVRLNFRQGADLIKVFLASGGITNTPEDLEAYPEFSLDELRAIVDEAHRREKARSGPRDGSAVRAARPGGRRGHHGAWPDWAQPRAAGENSGSRCVLLPHHKHIPLDCYGRRAMERICRRHRSGESTRWTTSSRWWGLQMKWE